MDTTAVQILKKLIAKKDISMAVLGKELELTDGQIQYRIKKINEELELLRLGRLTKRGSVIVLEANRKALEDYLGDVSPLIHLSEKERIYYIYLIILSNENENLNSIAERLSVSKNTILSDKKKLQDDYLGKLAIVLKYSRKKGFYLVGKELAIRRLGIQFFSEVRKMSEHIETFFKLVSIDYELFKNIQAKIHELEKDLDLAFTELKLIEIYLITYLSITRFLQDNCLKKSEIGNYIQMVEPDFYEAVYHALQGFFASKTSTTEIQFIAIQLLSTSLIKIRSAQKDEQLIKALQEFVGTFEKLGVTDIKNKTQLLDNLYQHLIPAYYRIKFGIPDNEMLQTEYIENYEYIQPIVQQSIGILEEYFDIVFPEGELIYISIILLSFINEDIKKQKSKRKNAIVVCQHGVSVSKLLFEELKLLFNNIYFVRYSSVREFYEITTEESFDLIFSTVPLQTTREVILINPVLSEEEKGNIKNEVSRKLHGIVTNHDTKKIGQDLLQLVGDTVTLSKKQQDQILEKFNSYFAGSSPNTKVSYQTKDPSLLELLPQNHIQIYSKCQSAEEAIRYAAKPLLEGGFVTERYLDQMIMHYDPMYPYFVIAPQVAIPHAGPEDGVIKLGMSLLRLSEPVYFTPQLPVKFLFCIAPKDKNSHMKALTTLYPLVKDSDFIEKLAKLPYEKDIYQALVERLKEGEE